MVADSDFNIVFVNSNAEQLLCASFSKIQQLSIIELLNPIKANSETNTQHSSPLRQQFDHCHHLNQSFVQHDVMIQAVNEPMLVDYAVSPMENADSEAKAFFYVVELWAKDRQSRINQEQQQQAQHHATRQIIRNMAHEVKNPLAGILGANQLLQKNIHQILAMITEPNSNDSDKIHSQKISEKTAKIDNYLTIIQQETQRLNHLVSQLLGSTHLPNWQSINVHQPLEQVLNLVKLQPYPIDFVRDYDLSLPNVVADNDQLVQVFLNIINNAMQSLQENATPSPTITLRTRIAYQYTIGDIRHKSVLKIDIIDNGQGIDEALLPQIFYPLVTGREAGTGLGLALVQDIVQRHHGVVNVTSKTGETIFTILLP
ncbi:MULTISPECIES: two-component system sensor histidine kinase NtrB [unclassified Moraxella]|uniref:two-component system sensor histidine kinase NtrB n=1 Tax=unclassified Moraxella TaxID=2685852 RepID=UPI003AF851EB